MAVDGEARLSARRSKKAFRSGSALMDARKSKFVDARAQATEARVEGVAHALAEVAHRAPRARRRAPLDKFGKFQRLAAARALADRAPRPPERRRLEGLRGAAELRDVAAHHPTAVAPRAVVAAPAGPHHLLDGALDGLGLGQLHEVRVVGVVGERAAVRVDD